MSRIYASLILSWLSSVALLFVKASLFPFSCKISLSLVSFYSASRLDFIYNISMCSLSLDSTLCFYETIALAYSLFASISSLAWTFNCSYFPIMSRIYASLILSWLSSVALLFVKASLFPFSCKISLSLVSFYSVSRLDFIYNISMCSLSLDSTLCFYEAIALAY